MLKPILVSIALLLLVRLADASTSAVTMTAINHWQLSDVLRLAMDNNPDLKSAEANFQATSKTVMQAVSGYLPQINVIANVSQTNLPSPSAGASSQLGESLTYSSAAVSLTQTLFDFGKVLSSINARRAEASSAEEQAVAVKFVVRVAVERAFYEVIASQKLLDAANRSLEQFQETYRTTGVLVRTGARPSFDLTQANVQLAKAKLGEINARNFLDLSKIVLINLIGINNSGEFELQEPDHYEATPSTQMDLTDLEKKALEFRPEMKQSEYAVNRARFRLHEVVTEYFPTLAFQGYYGSYQPNYPVAIRTAWSAGIGLTWNLFDGLKTTSRVGELSYRLDEEESQQDKERDSIEAEVASNYKELVRAESQLEVSDDALKSARENSDLAHKRYQAGVATILELLTAEASLVEAEGAAIQAKYQRQIALSQLHKSVNAPLVAAK